MQENKDNPRDRLTKESKTGHFPKKSSTEIEWHFPTAQKEQGIITACDQNYEWMLPFWWDNYSRYNEEPVTFIDFGLSIEGQEYCRQRGDLLQIEAPKAQDENEIAASFQADWNPSNCKRWWAQRQRWMKKPFAYLMSPYKNTIWLDLDCQVVRSLHPLWEHCQAFGCTKFPYAGLDYNPLGRFADETIYSCGVLAFSHGSAIIEAVAKETLENNDKYPGDDDILSRILYSKKYSFQVLSPLYNWICQECVHPEATVLHWWNKTALKTVVDFHMALKPY